MVSRMPVSAKITKVKYELRLPIKLPRLNVVLRWGWRKRAQVVKAMRATVVAYAAEAGMMSVEPFREAKVTLAIAGPYKTDSDGIYVKDLIDAICARKDVAYGYNLRRWGLIEDDGPVFIGQPRIVMHRYAPDWLVTVTVEGR